MAAVKTSTRKSGSEREASSAENSTLAVYWAAWATAWRVIFSTWAGDFFSLCSMCSGEVARKVWMRGLAASLTASQVRSMSLSRARDSPATWQCLISLAMTRTASKSPSLAMGKPASMTSTPRLSRRRAIRIFSRRFMVAPGDCSPSRRVVSKIMTRLGRFMGNAPCPGSLRVCLRRLFCIEKRGEGKAQISASAARPGTKGGGRPAEVRGAWGIES